MRLDHTTVPRRRRGPSHYALTEVLRRVPATAWVLLTAVVLWQVYGLGFVGYDAAFALVWGRDVVAGQLPAFEVPVAPTPHPLANLAGGVVSLLGEGATDALAVLSLVLFACLGWTAFRFGACAFSAPVGGLFALLVLTRPALVVDMHNALIDVPFLALVLWAALTETSKPSRGLPALGALAAAGLLRPEGWLLAIGYAAYLTRGAGTAQKLRYGALALSAPVVWAAFDLAVTGDPLFSLTGTQDAAARLDRPAGIEAAVRLAPEYLVLLAGEPVVLAGLVGAAIGLGMLYRASVLPSVLLWLGLAAFLVLGIAGLPLLTRYLLLPGVMLTVFCAVAVLGWSLVSRKGARRAWLVLGILAAVASLNSIPATVRVLDSVIGYASSQRSAQQALRELALSDSARPWLARCSRVYAPGHRPVPVLAYWLARDLRSFSVRPVGKDPPDGAIVNPASRVVRELTARSGILQGWQPRFDSPARYRLVAANADWHLYARCR